MTFVAHRNLKPYLYSLMITSEKVHLLSDTHMLMCLRVRWCGVLLMLAIILHWGVNREYGTSSARRSFSLSLQTQNTVTGALTADAGLIDSAGPYVAEKHDSLLQQPGALQY